jgi:putative transposase
VVDEFTRECRAIEVAGSFNAHQVIGVLEILLAQQGAPQFLRSDNGPEFIAQALQQWLADNGIRTFYIQPGSPWENAYSASSSLPLSSSFQRHGPVAQKDRAAVS